MYRIFETFVESLSESAGSADLCETMAATARQIELPSFAYLSLPGESITAPQLLSNYPIAWTSHYLHRRYDSIDPVILQTRSNSQPFRWGIGSYPASVSHAQLEFFGEASEFGIRSGFTIPIHDNRGQSAALTFASDAHKLTALGAAERYEQALRLMATLFHIRARRLSTADRIVNGAKLTPREYECLKWAARGKSAWEIGRILGIARRTAAFHLDNARQKLGVRTIAQAVVRLASSDSFFL